MYRTIDTALWSDPAVRSLKSASKLLFVYLITNQHAHVSGIYFLPLSYILHDTGLTEEIVRKGIDTLSGAGLTRFDPERDIVWVCKMLRYQGCGEKTFRSAANQLKTLHNSPLIKEFLHAYPAVKPFFKHRVTIPYPAQDDFGIQEQEQSIKTPLPPKGGKRGGRSKNRSDPEGFAEFWQAYPRKHGKAKALQAWLRLSPDAALRAILLDALVRQKRWPQWNRDEGAYVPHASTWLHGRRWEDQEYRPPTATEPSPSPEERAAKLRADRAAEERLRAEIQPDPDARQKVHKLARNVGAGRKEGADG